MKLILATLTFTVISFVSFSQTIPKNPNVTDAKGFRQGKWTLLFDANWAPVTSYDSAINYRLIEYTNNKPVGLVRDFYPSGAIQWEGKLVTDRPQDVIHGEATWYREDGSKEMVRKFDKGKQLSVVYYNPDGTTATENWLSLNERGMKEYGEGNVHQSLATFELALVQAGKEFGPEHFNYSSTLNNLAFIHQNLGEFVKAEPLLLESASITLNVVGENHPEYALVLNNLAFFYLEAGNYAKSDSIFLQSLEIRKATVGTEHPDYAQSLNNLAMLYSKQGNDRKAISMYDDVRKVISKTLGKDHTNYASVLNNLSVAYNNLGDHERAIALSAEALEIRKKINGPDHPDYAQSLYILAYMYSHAGLYTKAQPLYEESALTIRKRLGADHPQYAHALDNLANLYIKTGFYKKAKELLNEALKIREKTIGKDHFEYGITLANLAELDVNLHLYAEAESLFNQAMEITARAYGENHQSYISLMNNLAMLYAKNAQYEKADALYQRSLKGNQQLGNKEEYSALLNNLAQLKFLQNKLNEADSLQQESIKVLYSVSKKENPRYFMYLDNHARILVAAGDYEKANSILYEVKVHLLEQINTYFNRASDSEKKIYYTEKISPHFHLYNSFAIEAADKFPKEVIGEMYSSQLITKALLFNANNQVRERILTGKNDQLIKQFENWQDQRNFLIKAYQMSRDERIAKKIDLAQLEDQINTIERDLSQQSTDFSKSNSRNVYDWKDVQQKLDKNEAAIEIIRVKKFGQDTSNVIYYACLILTKKSKMPELVLLKNGNDLERKFIKFYRNSIQFKLEDSISYQQFWKPMADILAKNKIKKAYVCQDGVFNSINLNVLRNPATKRFVYEDVEIQVITNSKDLVNRKKFLSDISREACLFGYPNYSDNAAEPGEDRSLQQERAYEGQRFFVNGKISALPATKVEINEVAKVLTGYHVKVKEQIQLSASEESIKSVSSPSILHIATHGFFLENVDFSFAGFDTKRIMGDPLLRSGLLLANSQQTIDGNLNLNHEDGILTAYEAMNLNLEGTELVVLSACETGLGEIRNGEGVYGLQRAFQTAGAKSILMSLWKVDDNATQELMTGFYKNWLKSGDKRDAFKKAQESVRKKYPHPYYWGAFVLVGE